MAVVAGDVFYVYADHINTPRVIARSIDNLTVWSWHAADPFGARLQISDPSGLGEFTYNPRFPGQLYDQETGTHYNYYRDYDPRTGRYAQSDPLGLAGGINTYGYVGGNPVNLADPLGLINPGSAVGAGLGSLMLPGPGTIIGGIIGTGLGAWGIYDFTRPNAKVMPASSRVPRPPGMTRREERHFDRHCANSDDPCRSLKAAVAIAIGEAHVKMDKMVNDKALNQHAYSVPNPALTKTNATWVGHVNDLNGRTNAIWDMIALGRRMGCDMSAETAAAMAIHTPGAPRG